MDAALESIIIADLQKDIAYMFFVFDKRNNVDEDVVFDLNRARSAYFTNPQELLSHILQIISFMNRSADILEIMPMIDEYIEFMCKDTVTPEDNKHYFGDYEEELADADMD